MLAEFKMSKTAMKMKLGMQEKSKCDDQFMKDLNEYGIKLIREKGERITR